MKYPVLASLALLGACSVEYSIGGGGGGGERSFDATKIGELVKEVARKNLGEPSAVRCPPKMQWVPRDRYTCQFDVEGAAYDVIVRHGVFMTVNAALAEPAMGFEPLARAIEGTDPDGKLEVDCSGVLVSPSKPSGVCMVADGRGALVRIVNDELKINFMEWNGWD